MDNSPDNPNDANQTLQSPPSSKRRSRPSSDVDSKVMTDSRFKARERQRRKRERDRSGRDKSGNNSAISTTTQFPSGDNDDPSQQQQQQEQQQQQMDVYAPSNDPHVPNGHDTPSQVGGGGGDDSMDLSMSPEEAAKKDRVRAAARERQRKHRAAVKAKRMAELGLAIVNAGGGVEQTAVGYMLNEHGQYEPVMQDPNNPHHPPHAVGGHEPPFPAPQPHSTPGQTFAATLLLSFSVAPLLKQHMLRTLHMTDEELASFEPIIAAAWDHWDHERALHYAAAATASASSEQNAAASTSYLPPHPPSHVHMYPASDFRARFQRPLVAPFPASAPQVLRTESSAAHHASNGSPSTANGGGYANERRDRREDGDSERDKDREESAGGAGKSTPPPTATESIDPNLEAAAANTTMSDVRGERDGPGELPTTILAQGPQTQAQAEGQDQESSTKKSDEKQKDQD